MYWVDGKLTDTIAVADRSFQYGDGCFTTMLTRYGHIQHWALHRERMEQALVTLGLPKPDWSQVQSWLTSACDTSPQAGLKLHVSAGVGGRGYGRPECVTPKVTISRFAYPKHYTQWMDTGVCLGLCEQKLGLNPMLAGHKHNNRLEQVLLKAEMEKTDYSDGLVLDLNHNVVETTAANLFWVKGTTLYTPDLNLSGVAGVMRRVVLEQASQQGLRMEIGAFPLSAVESADEIFMTNSLLQLAPVIQIQDHHFSIGPITRLLQENITS
ncbi:aminodeoxychorismate lyase [Vibrio profundum]|uniref:aminodeoxychorismate lyase n=1 Tax=Vibrio profundum TaxID=2910247 RepID=UPI003D1338D8